jgi:hypothetical protein
MLSELAMRILSELEEAGEENVTAMLNTVVDGTGTEEQISSYQQALRELVQADLARMSIERDVSRRLVRASSLTSEEQIEGIASFLVFDHQAQRWRDRRRTGPPFIDPFPHIVCTSSGKQKGFEILDKRGYQWWRTKS